MKKRLILIILIFSVLLIASILYIGQEQLEANDQPVNESNQKEEKDVFYKKDVNKKLVENGHGESSDLSFSLNLADNNYQKFTYEVKNVSKKPVKIEFGTSQRYEVVLEKKGEGEVYRFSKGRMFMQVLGELNLEPTEVKKFDINLPELQPGSYSLTVYLVGKEVSSSSKRMMHFTINDE